MNTAKRMYVLGFSKISCKQTERWKEWTESTLVGIKNRVKLPTSNSFRKAKE